MKPQDELRRLAASLHFAEDRISVFRAANKIDELEAEVERLNDTRERQRICSECGGKIKLVTADLDWCPSCKINELEREVERLRSASADAGRKGGIARSAKLAPEIRKGIAKRAAKARWTNERLRAAQQEGGK